MGASKFGHISGPNFVTQFHENSKRAAAIENKTVTSVSAKKEVKAEKVVEQAIAEVVEKTDAVVEKEEVVEKTEVVAKKTKTGK